MKRTILVSVLILAFLIAGCAQQETKPTPTPKATPTPTPTPAAKKLKVAFVYVSPIGDAGWSYAHDQGRIWIEKHLGVETKYSEAVPEGPDAERVIREYAEQGYDIIFTTSFGYMDSTITVAKDFPNTVFMHCSGYKTAKNVGTYFGRMYQARYLSGLVAGS
ncbi:BMP family ABC transporter substrate-binding protein, partial [Archaeoglobales archaeon]